MPKAAPAIETPTPRKHGPKPKAEELAVTTVRLRPDQSVAMGQKGGI